jgi:hypothetical protein
MAFALQFLDPAFQPLYLALQAKEHFRHRIRQILMPQINLRNLGIRYAPAVTDNDFARNSYHGTVGRHIPEHH